MCVQEKIVLKKILSVFTSSPFSWFFSYDIYFTTLGEQGKVYVDSLWWSMLVGLRPAYINPHVSHLLYHCATDAGNSCAITRSLSNPSLLSPSFTIFLCVNVLQRVLVVYLCIGEDGLCVEEDLLRVHLTLQFMQHLEKQLYNAYEGSALAMPQPPKVRQANITIS